MTANPNTLQAGINPLDMTILDGSVNPTSLAFDAVGVVIQDSVRAGQFAVEPKLIASYVGANALYQIFGAKYLLPYLALVDPQIRDDVGAILYNTALMPVTARIFGGRISMTNALLTSAGARFFSKGAKTVLANSGTLV